MTFENKYFNKFINWNYFEKKYLNYFLIILNKNLHAPNSHRLPVSTKPLPIRNASGPKFCCALPHTNTQLRRNQSQAEICWQTDGATHSGVVPSLQGQKCKLCDACDGNRNGFRRTRLWLCEIYFEFLFFN